MKEAFKNHLLPKAVKVLERILAQPKHPYRHQVAMYVVDRVAGRPTVAVGGVDGAPLLPGSPAADNPIAALIARVTARRAAAAEAPTPSGAENSQPGASGEAERPS